MRGARATAAETGIESGVGDQAMGPAMVGVPIRRRRSEDDLGAPGTQDLDHRILFVFAVPKGAVAAVEKRHLDSAQSRRRCPGFKLPFLDGTPGSSLSSRQMQDAYVSVLGCEQSHRASAGQLDVVRVGSDRKDIELQG